MRLSQSGSVSSSKRGDGNRLGTRIRKKRKRLDAICEDVFNRSRGIKMESKGNGQANSMGDDFELRRSSRVRRAPEILDASPPPPRKRRKNGEFGKEIRRGVVEKVKRKGGLKKGVSDSSDSVGSEEDLGGWKSRLRSRDKGVSLRVEGNGHSLRRKRKLFTDLDEAVVVPKEEAEEEEEEEEDEEVKGDEREGMDGEKSLVVDLTMAAGISDSSDNEVQLHSDGENSSENNGVNSLESEDSEDDSRSMNRSGEKDEEGMAGDGAEQLTMKEDEVLTSTHEETKKIGDECVELINQNNDSRDPSKILEEEGNRIDGVQVGTRSSSLMEDGEHHDGNGSAPANSLEKQVECENAPKPDNQHVSFTDGHPIPRIKEGRRCRLCGGRNDGKPPKRLATDATGSDHETYSCSSASEEPNYDAWDGFGDEPGWLGRLLGPINDRYGIAGIWVHQHCAVWSPEVYFAGLGCLKNVRAALCRGRALKCTRCGRPGATLGCRVDRCPKTYHLPCARASGCIFDHRKFLIACGDHRYLFQPQGQQYVQRIKKLKAKKLKLEVKKQSNDASRKDLEAEEKWMEKCGEDEEFLRRENKRLQRDLSRIAPVYIGGAQSEGDEFFEGWESVAGLQDVIQCMKEVVILPLLYPDFFENMGITPPRGVLLHGYPGTGKTLVVRALIGSCARGDKKIAYFARKGADCLGKYVGDAERQLRLLFQVAEKSQPSIIFFDEIDGLAPVRTRQQDQTHSSVVSTLLALMDGLKSRGSVIVIGATNRPDAVDPALRRPGRFDREIYFPLPSVEDRAAILALHTKKWPKPVTGSLLQWIARRTVGFAGADLQALCAHAAIIALKRHCPLQQILSVTQENSVKFKLPQLPNFTVEERDWLEALSSAPPPCSRREAGMAANEVIGSPLQVHFLPSLMQPLTILIISLNLDDRIWLPAPLFKAAASIKRAIISAMEKRNVRSDQWWCHARNLVEESNTANEIKESLSSVGILFGDASCSGANLSNDVSVEDNARLDPGGSHVTRSRLVRNLCFVPKKAGYRILIAGDARSGQKHLVSCLLWCFVGNVEIQKIDLATISQEGHGVMEQGISQILMKCSSMKSCVLFMPRIDLWAIELENRISQKEIESSTDNPSSDDDESSLRRQCGEGMNASQAWRSFVEQMESICMAASLIIVATSEVSSSALPHEVRQFFGDEPLSSKTLGPPEHGLPRFILNLDGSFDRDILFRSSVSELSRDLTQLFIQLIHYKNHSHLKPGLTLKGSSDEETDMETHNCDPQTVEEPERPIKTPVTSDRRNAKSKLSLLLAITTFGYQLLRYPHFAELCWVTSKLKDGPTADIRGPWKGWPFNSCIVRPGNTLEKEAVTCSLSSVKGKDKFNLVRGLVAVGLSAYRGVYISATEVSLEVRKVLELLVEQITAKIQAGKDRYQFIRLLSQVAYVDDMVNSWAYSLRSLERDAQVTPRLTGSGSPDKYMANVQLQAEGDPKIPSIDLDPDNDKGILPGSTLEKPQATDLNKEVSEIGVEVSRELVDSRKVPLEVSAEDTQGNGISNENEKGCETFESEHLEEASRSKHLGDVNELNPFANSKDTSMVGGDSQFLEQSNESSCRESLKLETTCFYKCCDQCLPALHQLLQKIITTSSERSSSFSTLEDFHDLISSLSANLCSAVSKSYVTNKNSHSLDEKLSESHEKQSENELVLPRECICHHPEESSSFSQIGFDLKFTYKDGVLVQTDAAKDVDFHCKYEAVCLCSLIESIQNAAASVLTCH